MRREGRRGRGRKLVSGGQVVRMGHTWAEPSLTRYPTTGCSLQLELRTGAHNLHCKAEAVH